jgi:hypothetical protein
MQFSLLIYFNNNPLHVSNRLTIHHQEVALLYMQHMVRVFIVHLRWLAASTIGVERTGTINSVCCLYSKTAPDDEELIYSKHVEDYY